MLVRFFLPSPFVRAHRFFGSKLPVVVLAIGLLVQGLSVSASQAQTGDDAYRFARKMPGVSAFSMGVAGTGIAGVSDGSAFVSNPAGLGWAKGSYFSGGLTMSRTQEDGTFKAPGSTSFLGNEVTNTSLGSMAYLFKVPTSRGSMVVGASFHQVSTFERSLLYGGENNANSLTDYLMPLSSEFTIRTDAEGDFPEFDRTLSFLAYETYAIDLDQGKLDAGDAVPFNPAVSAGTVSQNGFVDETGRMSELNFGGSVEVAPNVMVGASLTVPFGSYSFSREIEEADINDANDGFNGTTDFDYLRFNEQVSSDVVGAGLRFGVSALVNPELKLGLTIETPTYYSIDDKYSTILSTRFDNGDSFSYGGEDQDAGTGSFSYSVTSPWKLGVGGAYSVMGATFSADFELVDWSQMTMDSDSYAFNDENRAIKRGLNAVTNTRIGVSYDVTGSLVIRGGFATNVDPHASSSAGSSSLNADRTYYSLGLGYKVGDTFRADLGWMVESFDDVYEVYNEVANAPFVTEEVSRSQFKLGVSFGL